MKLARIDLTDVVDKQRIPGKRFFKKTYPNIVFLLLSNVPLESTFKFKIRDGVWTPQALRR